MDAEPPDPPADLPDDVVEHLQALSDHHLRETVAYASELLGRRRTESDDTGDADARITAGPGEELLAVEERDGYTAVVKREPCGDPDCESCPHGPYLYHVTTETHLDGSETTHWTLIGRTDEKRWRE